MKTNSLEILESSKLPPEQARAILKTMEIELAEPYDELVAKIDLLATKTELAAITTKLDLFATKTEVNVITAKLDLFATKAELAAVAAKMDLFATKAELYAVRDALTIKIEELRSEMKDLGTKLVLWMFGMQVAVATLLYAVLTRGRP